MDRLPREGWEALAAADWPTARRSFEEALAESESAEALDGLSQALQFLCEYDAATEVKERAFAAYRREGRPADAADTARWLAFLHGTYNGNFAVASGWMGRAQSLLEGVEECASHGWLILDGAVFTRDAKEREQCAASALTIARRFGDADLEFEAIALLGETKVATGRLAEGMLLLDQAMAAVTAGEVAAHGAMGEICCRLLSACEHATDVRRAEEWMALADRHVAWADFVRPTCRTHYGGILVALGRWDEAETELRYAIETFERGYRGDGAFPLVRLAGLRVRQGRYEEAERLLEGVEWHPAARQRDHRRGAATSASRRSSPSSASRAATPPTSPARRSWSCWSRSSSHAGRRRRRRRRWRGWSSSPQAPAASSCKPSRSWAPGACAPPGATRVPPRTSRARSRRSRGSASRTRPAVRGSSWREC